jgi:hypothetical protein
LQIELLLNFPDGTLPRNQADEGQRPLDAFFAERGTGVKHGQGSLSAKKGKGYSWKVDWRDF